MWENVKRFEQINLCREIVEIGRRQSGHPEIDRDRDKMVQLLPSLLNLKAPRKIKFSNMLFS